MDRYVGRQEAARFNPEKKKADKPVTADAAFNLKDGDSMSDLQ
jgi:hypothetical protein